MPTTALFKIQALRATATWTRDGPRGRSTSFWRLGWGNDEYRGYAARALKGDPDVNPDWKDHGGKWRILAERN